MVIVERLPYRNAVTFRNNLGYYYRMVFLDRVFAGSIFMLMYFAYNLLFSRAGLSLLAALFPVVYC